MQSQLRIFQLKFSRKRWFKLSRESESEGRKSLRELMVTFMLGHSAGLGEPGLAGSSAPRPWLEHQAGGCSTYFHKKLWTVYVFTQRRKQRVCKISRSCAKWENNLVSSLTASFWGRLFVLCSRFNMESGPFVAVLILVQKFQACGPWECWVATGILQKACLNQVFGSKLSQEAAL